MGRFARTWQLMGASWRMLKQDKSLIVFPVVSGLALAVVIALFAGPIFVTAGANPEMARQSHWSLQTYLGLFVFYFLAYAVITFFNSALLACVFKQMDGEQPTLGFGLKFAWGRIGQILGWALLTSTVGILLRLLEEKVGFIGRIVVGLLGMAWSVTSFLVVPVLVVEGTGPIESYKRSVEMLKRTWGEQIIGNVSFGLMFMLFGAAPAFILILLVMHSGQVVIATTIAIIVVYLVLLGLVQSTLQTIYQAAIYCYAATGEAPAGFDGQLIADAFREKTRKSWL